jgi:hypothetical protein
LLFLTWDNGHFDESFGFSAVLEVMKWIGSECTKRTLEKSISSKKVQHGQMTRETKIKGIEEK